jgi:hypothetical protein
MDVTNELAVNTAEDSWGPRQSRTVNWRELGPSLTQAMSMSGIEHLQAMMNGEMPGPPFAELCR